MDIATLIGLALAFAGIVGGNIAEGGDPMALVNLPGFLIVLVGTLGATVAAQPLQAVLGVPRAILKAFRGASQHDSPETVERAGRHAPTDPAAKGCSPSNPRSRTSTTPSCARVSSS
ncbi:MAG: motility-associated protein [Dehalococcoidia bacterium]|nr:motility-associated protein [Dehalococcoidia bacterium]